MPDVEFNFESNSVVVHRTMCNKVEALLLEVSAEIVSQTARNTKVKTGQTKGSWAANLTNDGKEYTANIGSDYENAIWEEFGTGEYALKGDGRKGGWAYEDPDTGETVWTHGKRARRPFWNAYIKLKNKIIRHIQREFRKGLS
jgi:hypothetical protein